MAQANKPSLITGEWECAVCGFVVEGNKSRPPRECPECDAPGGGMDSFEYDDDDLDWDHTYSEEDEND